MTASTFADMSRRGARQTWGAVPAVSALMLRRRPQSQRGPSRLVLVVGLRWWVLVAVLFGLGVWWYLRLVLAATVVGVLIAVALAFSLVAGIATAVARSR